MNIEGTPRLDPAIYELGIPIFGICYGAQLIAMQLGGTVGRGLAGEYGAEFQKAPLDPAERAGVFTQVGFLASNATSVNPDPATQVAPNTRLIVLAGPDFVPPS